MTRQDPAGFGFSNRKKPLPRTYTRVTDPPDTGRSWPSTAPTAGTVWTDLAPAGLGTRSLPTGPRSSLRKDERCKAQYKGFISAQQVTQTFL